jgi:hypothetical protein
VFAAVIIGDIIIHAVERNSLNSALLVVCVSHGIVTALDLGYYVKSAKLSCAVFLSVFGAVSDGGYGAVLVSAVGEFTAVGKTFGFDIKTGCRSSPKIL